MRTLRASRFVGRMAAVSAVVAACVLTVPSSTAQSGAPDGPCTWEGDRFADCGNGTVTDAATGLIWLQQADCLMNVPVAEAATRAAALSAGQCGLFDGSVAGDWRLPTRDEWLATVAPTLKLGCRAALEGLLPSMSERPWADCFQELEAEHDTNATFASVFSPIYLANEMDGGSPTVATVAFVGSGDSNFAGSFGVGFELRLWPVRSRPR